MAPAWKEKLAIRHGRWLAAMCPAPFGAVRSGMTAGLDGLHGLVPHRVAGSHSSPSLWSRPVRATDHASAPARRKRRTAGNRGLCRDGPTSLLPRHHRPDDARGLVDQRDGDDQMGSPGSNNAPAAGPSASPAGEADHPAQEIGVRGSLQKARHERSSRRSSWWSPVCGRRSQSNSTGDPGMAPALDRWPACARPVTIASAGHLLTAAPPLGLAAAPAICNDGLDHGRRWRTGCQATSDWTCRRRLTGC